MDQLAWYAFNKTMTHTKFNFFMISDIHPSIRFAVKTSCLETDLNKDDRLRAALLSYALLFTCEEKKPNKYLLACSNIWSVCVCVTRLCELFTNRLRVPLIGVCDGESHTFAKCRIRTCERRHSFVSRTHTITHMGLVWLHMDFF